MQVTPENTAPGGQARIHDTGSTPTSTRPPEVHAGDDQDNRPTTRQFDNHRARVARQQFAMQAPDLASELLPASPEDGELLTNLAYYNARMGDDERASQYLARALFAAPNDVYAHYYAALVHLEAGRRQQALEEISRSVELGYPIVLLAPDPQFAALRRDGSFRALIGEPGN